YWSAFRDNSLAETTKFRFAGSPSAKEINNLETVQIWKEAVESLAKAIPFVRTFFNVLQELKTEGQLNDQFYLNYEVENIDFEAVMISSFMHYARGLYQDDHNEAKLGVTVQALKDFYHQFFINQGEEYLIKGEEDPIL